MDFSQLKLIVEEAVANGVHFDWWFYLLFFLIVAFGAFLGAYLKKKAESVATKEDIQEITKKIEDIRAHYSAELESHKASLQLSNQLKLAALDKRLQKHQGIEGTLLTIVTNSASHASQQRPICPTIIS